MRQVGRLAPWTRLARSSTSPWLRARVGDPGIVVVDCRWKLGEPGAGEPRTGAAASPARRSSTSTRPVPRRRAPAGRHPLPDAGRLRARGPARGHRRRLARGRLRRGGRGRAPRGSGGCCGTSATTALRSSTAAWPRGAAAGGPLEAGRAEPGARRLHARARATDDVATLDELRERAPAATGARPDRRPRARALPRRASSRSTRSPATSPARATCRSPTLAPGGRFLDPARAARAPGRGRRRARRGHRRVLRLGHQRGRV